MNTIRYTDSIDEIAPEQLEGFFVDWPSHPDATSHREILKRSFKTWLALDGERCIGFVNALSDGVFYAYIPLLEVLPEYQGRGIGAELVKRMVRSLDSMYAIDVVCDESVVPFYEKLGFGRCVGMVKRDYKNQNPANKGLLLPERRPNSPKTKSAKKL